MACEGSWNYAWAADLSLFGGLRAHEPLSPSDFRAGDSAGRALSSTQSRASVTEELLLREGAAEEESDAAGVAHHDRTELQQLEPNGCDLCSGQVGSLQAQATDCFHQYVGAGREQHPELIGPPGMA